MTEFVKHGLKTPIQLRSIELLQEFGAVVPAELIDRLPNMNDAYARGLVFETSKPETYKVAIESKHQYIKEINTRELMAMSDEAYID